jgi:hypothetical protein
MSQKPKKIRPIRREKIMEFTFVTRCHCGCETSQVISVEARDVKTAIENLEREWERQERGVSIIAIFEDAPRTLVPVCSA